MVPVRDWLAPLFLGYAMGRPFWEGYRRRVLAPARGRVLEVGFGTGANLGFYPDEVRGIVAVEPDAALAGNAGRAVASSGMAVSLVRAKAERLPFPDAAFDTVVTTLTLCSVADPWTAVFELRRVLRPGGSYLFLEHGRADEPGVASWQDRLDPLSVRLPCGCRLNRDISEIVGAGRFASVEMREGYVPGMLRVNGLLSEGRAVR